MRDIKTIVSDKKAFVKWLSTKSGSYNYGDIHHCLGAQWLTHCGLKDANFGMVSGDYIDASGHRRQVYLFSEIAIIAAGSPHTFEGAFKRAEEVIPGAFE